MENSSVAAETRIERPCVAYEANDAGYYAVSDADLVFDQLEQALADALSARDTYKAQCDRLLTRLEFYEPIISELAGLK